MVTLGTRLTLGRPLGREFASETSKSSFVWSRITHDAAALVRETTSTQKINTTYNASQPQHEHEHHFFINCYSFYSYSHFHHVLCCLTSQAQVLFVTLLRRCEQFNTYAVSIWSKHCNSREDIGSFDIRRSSWSPIRMRSTSLQIQSSPFIYRRQGSVYGDFNKNFSNEANRDVVFQSLLEPTI